MIDRVSLVLAVDTFDRFLKGLKSGRMTGHWGCRMNHFKGLSTLRFTEAVKWVNLI